LDYIAEEYSVQLSKKEYFERFEELIMKLGQTEKVVILIDEYDKPIIDHLEDTELALQMREVMKGFFTVLKGNDAYSTLVGITEEELKKEFSTYLSDLAIKENKTEDETLNTIRAWYNGYRFSPEGVSVYNPFSTLLLFEKRRFEHHWFETGTPEFLVKLIVKNNYDIIEIPFKTDALNFSSYEVDDLSLTPLLVQTGYLTIKGFDAEDRIYTLDYPNFEVKKAFLTYFIHKFRKKELSGSLILKLTDSIQEDDLERSIQILRKCLQA